ncbi:MAG: esterase-like activity of phytase family protein [Chitinophagaceae bacterium]|nr:MAG: esterase-like activity of phytase family protein [Chitinophagaceae bacterium]
MKKLALYFGVLICVFCYSCTSTTQLSRNKKIPQLQLLDVYEIPFKTYYQNTWVGGLSGIDYDAQSNQYYIICDDRSQHQAARFYTADIQIKQNKIDTIIFKDVQVLKSPFKDTFPSVFKNPLKAADPESIRWNASKQNFIWTSEGDRMVRNGVMIQQNPFIYEMSKTGYFLDSFEIVDRLKVDKDGIGPRNNGVFEGSALDKNDDNLFVSVEEPMYQDGEKADAHKGWVIRINQFNTANKKLKAQYAYVIDPVAYEAQPKDAFKVNGVAEIMWWKTQQLLVLERSYSTGRIPCTIKLYLTDLSKASNIKDVLSVTLDSKLSFASKKLILNMDNLNRHIDNVEGICLGPKLPNGNPTLILISDNNFNPQQKTQIFLFEIL